MSDQMQKQTQEQTQERTGEDQQERTARELIELLNELRVILPGIQVLFAFLLTVPFSQGFPKLDTLQQDVFFATLLCTAVSAALLMAPSAHHRLLFRQGEREQRLRIGNVVTIIGLIFLVPAMVGVVFVVTGLIFGMTLALTVTAILTLLFVLLWFILPLRYRDENAAE